MAARQRFCRFPAECRSRRALCFHGDAEVDGPIRCRYLFTDCDKVAAWTGDVRLIRSPISVAGMVLTTISAVLFLVVFLADVLGLHTNPYIGIVFFLVLPGLFVIGLLLIPLGAWVERRRRAAGKRALGRPLAADRSQRLRPSGRPPSSSSALTMANIVIVSLGAYRGVEYMDSVQFCGQACHTRHAAGVRRARDRCRTRT